jgi:hypothetical protein
LEELTNFLEEMELHEQIERARQIDIPGIFHQGQCKDIALRDKLKQAHEKEIQLSSLIIRPLRDNDDTFQYLNHDTKFTSTTTTRVFASLWSVDDTRHDRLVFPPPYNTDRIVEPEKFPSQSIYKRKRLEEDEDMPPPIAFPSSSKQPNNGLGEIPMPTVAASTKKAKRSSGISKSVPIVLSDDEEEDKITPARLAQSIVAPRPPPITSSTQQLLSVPTATPSFASKFANTSTQPLPGVFGARTKKPSAVVKKKKSKPKTSGFK